MRYFIGYLGGGDIEKYYQNITSELSDKFGIRNLSRKVPVHFTLKYPFESEDTSKVEKDIEVFLKNKTPTPFVINGFDKFGYKTIFLSVEPNGELMSLVKDCLSTLGDLGEIEKFDADEYRLHLSVARHLDPVTFELVWDHLSLLPNPHFELAFDNITLFVLEGGIWNVKKTFRMH